MSLRRSLLRLFIASLISGLLPGCTAARQRSVPWLTSALFGSGVSPLALPIQGGATNTDELARRDAEALNAALSKKRLAEARSILARMLRRHRKSAHTPRAMYNLASYLRNHSQKEQALKLFLKLMRLYPDSSQAQSAVYQVRYITGEYLYMYLGRTYAPGDKVHVNISSRKLDRLELQLWSVDLFDYVKRGHNPQSPNLFKMRHRKLVKKWTVPTNSRRYYSYTNVEIPVTRAGTYLLFVNGKYTSAGALLLVSDYGMIVKRASGRLLAFVTHRKKAKLGAGIRVDVLYEGKVVASGVTNKLGVFETPIDNKVGYRAIVLARVGRQTVISNAYYWYSTPPTATAFVYTDRPTYRPKHTVRFKVVARHRVSEEVAQRYSHKPGELVRVRIKDVKGGIVYDKKLQTNRFGAVDGQVALGADVPLGRYRVQATFAGRTFSAFFHVEAYKKPEFSVSVKANTGYVVGGGTMRVSVSAWYYYGQPVRKATVVYDVYRRQLYRPQYFYGWYSWYYNPWRSRSTHRGSFVSRGKGELGPDGKFSVTIPTDKGSNDRIYTVEVKVTDQSRRQISGSGTFKVTQGDFYLRVQTDKYAYSPGDSVDTSIWIKNHEQRPVAGQKVRVTVETRQRYGADYRYHSWKWRTLTSKVVHSNARGLASYKWTPDGQGYFRIRAEATDPQGNTMSTMRYLWYVSPSYSSVYRYSGLQLELDKQSYRVGEVARLIMTTGYKNAYALVTYESDRIHSYEVVKFNGSTLFHSHKVKPADSPNVRVVVSAIVDGAYVRRYQTLVVPPAENFLKVVVIPDKQKYEPNERVTATVRLVDHNGHPVVGEVTLGVVDEAIYAVRAENTKDIRKVFYGMRPWRVSTYHSLYFWSRVSTRQIRGLLSKDSRSPSPSVMMSPKKKGAMDKTLNESEKKPQLVEARVRKNFADTAYWAPAVVTGIDGRARVSFVMPDNLTSWRFTARAVTMRTKVGVATVNVISKKDLLVRLQTPRTLTEKDLVTITGNVHNYLTRTKTVHVDLVATGVKVLGKHKFVVKVAPGGEARVDFKVLAIGPRISKFTIRARTDEKSDAMQLKIPVLPYGVRQVVSKAGQIAGHYQTSLVVPGTADVKSASLKLVFSPSVAATMMDAVEYLVGYPYGCVEQTMSRLLPNVLVAQVLQKLKMRNKKLEHDLPKMVKKGTDRLFELQHDDGGWGWWKHDKTHPFMTAYAVYGLTMARKADYKVDQYRLSRGVAKLRSLIDEAKNLDTIAYMAHSLSLHERPKEPVLKKLYEQRAKLNDYGKALLYMTLVRVKRPTEARHVLAELEDRAHQTATTAYWGGKSWRYRWTDNKTETTAYVLKALVLANPKHPLITKTINYLVATRQGNRWSSTKDTAAVVYAFADFLKASGELDANYHFSVKLNGRVLKSAQITRENLVSFRGTLNIDGRALRPGANQLVVEKQGKGALYYATYLTYFNRAERLNATSNELSVKRAYYRIKVITDDHGKQKIEQIPFAGGSLKSGDELLVKLTITAPKAYQYLMVEDYLPSGCEIVKEAPKGHTNRYRYRHYYHWNKPYDHSEAHDAKMVFFKTNLAAGDLILTYKIRAETPGRYKTLPTYAELMYHPHVTATSSDFPLTVTD